MNILAFETGTEISSVALHTDKNGIIGEFSVRAPLMHSQTILPMLEALLAQTNHAFSDIDFLATAIGPGSFTGIRISSALVKGLSASLDVPTIGISSLEALAQNFCGFPDALICPVLDARREEVYTAQFSCKNGQIQRISEDSISSITALAESLKSLKTDVYLIGDAVSLLLDICGAESPHIQPAPALTAFYGASAVALRTADIIQNGIINEYSDITPIYLRLSQAERERLARESP